MTYIIAEAGVNHNGDIDLAKKMIVAAKNAGADCVKFQTFRSELLTSKSAEQAKYQKKNAYAKTQYEMLKKLELSYHEFTILNEFSQLNDIDFLSSPFDLESIDFLEQLDMKYWKIPSGEITNLPYLEKIAVSKKPIIMSTGMATISEIRDAVNIITKDRDLNDITLLHCTTEYPAPYEEINLRAIQSLRSFFSMDIGYSDHTIGIEVAVAATALGATVIEKHFTLDKNMEGPDHKASIDIVELEHLVKAIRNVETALGDGNKKPTLSERRNVNVVRKSIVASCDIAVGEIFSVENLTVKRPGGGISPMKWYEVIGKKSTQNYSKDEMIKP